MTPLIPSLNWTRRHGVTCLAVMFATLLSGCAVVLISDYDEATDKTVTAWIPLQKTPLEMGPLEFSAGSHQIVEGRELEISDDSEARIQQRLRVTDFKHVIEEFDLGEISFHSGWVFHRAGANTTKEMRKVMTVIYMDRDMKLKNPDNENQVKDWNTWCPGAEIGQVINSPINPVLY